VGVTLLSIFAIDSTADATAMTPLTLPAGRVIDLSHPITAGMPHWPGDPRTEVAPAADYASDGYRLLRLTLGEHSGTHLGTAAHFHPDGGTVDQLPPDHLVRPAVVFDAAAEAALNPDYRLSAATVLRWEAIHGPVPSGAIALLATGWDRRWPDPAAYFNPDAAGRFHFPGFGPDAAMLLVGQRGVVALGTDTHGVDAGSDAGLTVNRLLLRGTRYHLENLRNVTELPPVGAVLVVGVIAAEGGTGGPARVLALVP
jgi:kynurenine formamidase